MALAGETHFLGRVAQKALITNAEGAVLMVRTIGEERYAFPGGRLNEEEKPMAALVREVAEEIGAQIEVGHPYATDTWISSKGQPHFLVVYEAKLLDPLAPLIAGEGEIEEFRWITPAQAEALPIFDEYRHVLRDWFAEHV